MIWEAESPVAWCGLVVRTSPRSGWWTEGLHSWTMEQKETEWKQTGPSVAIFFQERSSQGSAHVTQGPDITSPNVLSPNSTALRTKPFMSNPWDIQHPNPITPFQLRPYLKTGVFLKEVHKLQICVYFKRYKLSVSFYFLDSSSAFERYTFCSFFLACNPPQAELSSLEHLEASEWLMLSVAYQPIINWQHLEGSYYVFISLVLFFCFSTAIYPLSLSSHWAPAWARCWHFQVAWWTECDCRRNESAASLFTCQFN